MRTFRLSLCGLALGIGLMAAPMPGQAAPKGHTPAAKSRGDRADTRKSSEYDVSPLETRVLAQRTWLRGGPASLRVIVTNHQTGKAVPAKVTLTLAKLDNGKPAADAKTLFT